MPKEFRLPDIGEGLTEAEVVRWLVPVGAPVKADQPVVEVETDKAVVEIPSPYAGVMLQHGAGEGEVVAVGAVLMVIGEPGEAWPPEAGVRQDPTGQETVRPIVGTISEAAEELPRPLPPLVGARRGVQALPIVRKLAKDLGVDLASVTGTGPEGRVTREDVLAASDKSPTAPAGEPRAVAERRPEPPLEATEERQKLSKLRRTISANMARSWQAIPHVTTFDAADGTRLLAARKSLEGRHDKKVPMEALVIKAVIPALQEYPEFNARLDGDDLVVRRRYHIGVAVDTPEGLLVAVARDADRVGLLDLADEITRLATRAKERRLRTDELTGQTFTVSNIGAVGGGFGTPIIPLDTTAILSVGRARDEPVARRGEVAVAAMIPLSLSYDHRVIDGALGRRFMAMVLENLEEPALFLAG